MNPEDSFTTVQERAELQQTFLSLHPLEEQYRTLGDQHEAGALGMWVFLATEVMFFGALFFGVGAYHIQYNHDFEATSAKMNWMVGAINTVVLLISSLFMVLAVHHAKLGNRRPLMLFLTLTALLGLAFLCLKGFEYWTDYRDYLIPGWRFHDDEWRKEGINPEHAKLFLMFYWIMTGLHAVHVTIGIGAVLVMFWLARRGVFTPAYYSPVDVTALYWHFVDTVWIFLFPMMYLLGTHTLADLKIL